MSASITPEDALKWLTEAGFEPIEEFPGRVHDSWRKRCQVCNKENNTALSQIKLGIGCNNCHLVQRKAKYSESSIEIAKVAGFEPLEEITGSKAPIKMRCLTCGWVGGKSMQSIRDGRKCASCSSRIKLTPEAASKELEKFGFLPLDTYVNAASKWKAKCVACGSIEYPRLSTLRAGHGCLNCSGSKKLEELDAVKLLLEHGFEALEPYRGSTLSWKCKCLKCGYVSNKRLTQIRNGRAGCAKCNGVAKISESEAIEVLLSKGLSPIEPYTSRRHPWKVRCEKCNEVFENSLLNISNSAGCAFCSGNARITPEKARELFASRDFELIGEFVSRGQRTECKCNVCGTIVFPTLKTVMRDKYARGCTNCASIQTTKRQIISHEDAAQTMLDHGLEPLEEYPGNQKRWRCRCTTCNSVVFPSRNYVHTTGNNGCRTCSDLVIVTPQEAVLELQRHGFEALEEFPGNTKAKWKMKCLDCDYESISSLGQRRKGRSCLYCSRANRTYEQGTSIYVAYHEELQSLKIGVGGKRRYKQHKNNGWLIIKTWRFESIELPYKIESQVLQNLRTDMEIPIHLLAESMPQGGHTETLSVDFLSPDELIEMVNGIVKQT